MHAVLRSRASRRVPSAHVLAHTSNSLRVRRVGTAAEASPENSTEAQAEGCLFVDSVFPIRFGSWDLRHYVGVFREEQLLSQLENILKLVNRHNFKVLSLEPRHKDGGVFVKFSYDEQAPGAVDEILKEVKAASDKKGGLPSWTGIKHISGGVWLVKGKPWREDLHRFASPMLKVAFDGPDIREEGLYEIFRPYGRIADLTPPTPGTAGALRSSIVVFRQARSAATARNCVHGLSIPNSGAFTRLNTAFERPIKAHAIRDWIAAHPRLVAPVIVFLIGTLTYTIFDPIRVFAVQAKMLDWFDYRKSTVYQWVRDNTIKRLSFALAGHQDESHPNDRNIWKERRDAEEDVQAYLDDLPHTVTFVHGPQGSGKSSMLFSLLKDNERPVLTIDCADLYKANSDPALLSSLARQTGYWPVFPFINSLNNLIDIASMGLIGQKAGLSASLETQVQDMLEVVGTGLKETNERAMRDAEHKLSAAEAAEVRKQAEAQRRSAIRRGTWHDPRLDCIAGNGIMCELGIGDELMRPEDGDGTFEDASSFSDDSGVEGISEGMNGKPGHQKTPSEMQELHTKPIVVIKNFATKHGRDDVIGVLAKWAATLVNNNVAHVIVVSDNRENAKVLAQALPSKPLHAVALSDADASSALSFVAQKLYETNDQKSMTPDERKSVERLGGRASDLETLVHKVRGGQKVQDAVEDIIGRGINELRKAAFGEDAEDAKSLSWSREQAWAVLKQLAKAEEISYHDVLLDFPFKGDEAALRSMEHAELITIGTHNGRPSVIKAGRPVYRFVFERLAADPVFRSTQELSLNAARIAGAEATVRSCEEELAKLSSFGEPVPVRASWFGKRNPATVRAIYILKKMQTAEATIEKLDAVNAELKKTLAKNP